MAKANSPGLAAGDRLLWREAASRFPRQLSRVQLLLDDGEQNWNEAWLTDCLPRLPKQDGVPGRIVSG